MSSGRGLKGLDGLTLKSQSWGPQSLQGDGRLSGSHLLGITARNRPPTDSWLLGSGPFTTACRHEQAYSRSHNEARVGEPGSVGQRSGGAGLVSQSHTKYCRALVLKQFIISLGRANLYRKIRYNDTLGSRKNTQSRQRPGSK